MTDVRSESFEFFTQPLNYLSHCFYEQIIVSLIQHMYSETLIHSGIKVTGFISESLNYALKLLVKTQSLNRFIQNAGSFRKVFKTQSLIHFSDLFKMQIHLATKQVTLFNIIFLCYIKSFSHERNHTSSLFLQKKSLDWQCGSLITAEICWTDEMHLTSLDSLGLPMECQPCCQRPLTETVLHN